MPDLIAGVFQRLTACFTSLTYLLSFVPINEMVKRGKDRSE